MQLHYFFNKHYVALLLLFLLGSCKNVMPMKSKNQGGFYSLKMQADRPVGEQKIISTIDKDATLETIALYNNLKNAGKLHTLFGHQDDTKTGYDWANEYDFQKMNAPYIIDSDVKKVTGAYPVVYGWDLSRIIDFYTGDRKAWETNITRNLTIEAYNRGGINTYSWHYHNPVAKEGIWWQDAQVEAVKHILPGGSHHEVYKKSLKELANYINSLIGADGKLIPIILRPFHEMNGDWFWWGKGHCTVQEYKQLYQFTVKYLRDDLGVHNLLFAWSPDRAFTTETQYLEYYPGDAYVDIVGIDNYFDLLPGNDPSVAGEKLKIISDFAIKKNKIAAFTETGLDKVYKANWFTQMLLPALKNQSIEISYLMLWSNTTDMYWTPYVGHPAVNDFIDFKNESSIVFSDEL
ncbi:glycoside hydrolase family 26 protein [Hymenobacter sp. HDW8]|uniref:glycoside hydrolase family 26 protein n=1 Tax=Hymenobacter sp. HDW8 TaxID=2714932 RepID=UPI001409BE58|nr:glycosyl hydrolase [Hymenobacter sp. HDW8]QIL77325.1 beta-mannosidase [Hymenobacter sp. HDW8]